LFDFRSEPVQPADIEGFDDRVTQMRSGSIEATFAEFDVGRFL